MKTSWHLYRKINFKLLINNQLGPAWRANNSKTFGCLFLSALGPRPNISILSTLVFLLLQKLEFTLHVRYCCVIRTWSSEFSVFLSPAVNRQRSSKLYSRCISWRGADTGFLFRSWWLHTAWSHSFQNLSYAQLWMGFDHKNYISAKAFAVLKIWWP